MNTTTTAADFCNGSLDSDTARLREGCMLGTLIHEAVEAYAAVERDQPENGPYDLTELDFEIYYRELAAETLGGSPEDF